MSLPKEINQKLIEWKKKHRLNKEQSNVLLECYRRVYMFNQGEINSNMALLSLPNEVKLCKDFVMTSYRKEEPRIKNWYKLTAQGRIIITDLMNTITWDEKTMNENLYITNEPIWMKR